MPYRPHSTATSQPKCLVGAQSPSSQLYDTNVLMRSSVNARGKGNENKERTRRPVKPRLAPDFIGEPPARAADGEVNDQVERYGDYQRQL
jgi:hypothetical protein